MENNIENLNNRTRNYIQDTETIINYYIKPKLKKVFEILKVIEAETNWKSVNNFKIDVETFSCETNNLLMELQAKLDSIQRYFQTEIGNLKFAVNLKMNEIENSDKNTKHQELFQLLENSIKNNKTIELTILPKLILD